MINVWAITVGEPLPSDGSGVRLYRTGLLTRQLAAGGHKVLWWSSRFDHAAKSHRAVDRDETPISPRLAIKWIDSPGYSANVSLRRIYDHLVAGRRFLELAGRETPPDVILCSLPTLDLAVAAVRYGVAHGVPVVIDVRDWWPDEFANALARWMRVPAAIAMHPFRRMAREACRSAVAITGISDAFVSWGLRHAGRAAGSRDRVFHMGYSAVPPAEPELATARRFWTEQGLADDGVPAVCYIGNVSNNVELDRVVAAVRTLQNGGMPLRFALCGSGDAYPHIRALASQGTGVIAPGRVGRAELWVAMERSHVAVAPYAPTASFSGSLSNKMLEYFAGGLPILTSLPHGPLVELLRQHRCGSTYTYGDVTSMAASMRAMLANPMELEQQGKRARALFESRFVAETIYQNMSDYLVDIAAEHRGMARVVC